MLQAAGDEGCRATVRLAPTSPPPPPHARRLSLPCSLALAHPSSGRADGRAHERPPGPIGGHARAPAESARCAQACRPGALSCCDGSRACAWIAGRERIGRKTALLVAAAAASSSPSGIAQRGRSLDSPEPHSSVCAAPCQAHCPFPRTTITAASSCPQHAARLQRSIDRSSSAGQGQAQSAQQARAALLYLTSGRPPLDESSHEASRYRCISCR